MSKHRSKFNNANNLGLRFHSPLREGLIPAICIALIVFKTTDPKRSNRMFLLMRSMNLESKYKLNQCR